MLAKPRDYCGVWGFSARPPGSNSLDIKGLHRRSSRLSRLWCWLVNAAFGQAKIFFSRMGAGILGLGRRHRGNGRNRSYPEWQVVTPVRCLSSRSRASPSMPVKADLEKFDAADLGERRPPPSGAQPGVRRRRAGQGAGRGCSTGPASAGSPGNFLKLITRQPPPFAVRDMIRGFRALVALLKGEVTARGDGRRAAFRRSSRRNQKLRLKAVTGEGRRAQRQGRSRRSSAGLMVKLGSRMVDSSLRTKLNAIKHAMKEAG